MRSDGHNLASLLARLSGWRVVLLHGGDEGLVRTRARELAQHAAGDAEDPFAVSEHSADEPEAIRASLASPAPFGKGRVVRVRAPTDRLTTTVQWALEQGGSALLLLQAGVLSSKSRLRDLVESSEAGCSVSCVIRTDGIDKALRRVFESLGVRADPAAMDALVRHVQIEAEDPQLLGLRAALFAGRDGTLSGEDALCLGEGFAGGALEAGFSSGLAGHAGVLDGAVTQAIAEGVAAVAVLRRALRQMQRVRSAPAHGARDRFGRGSARRLDPCSPRYGCGRPISYRTALQVDRLSRQLYSVGKRSCIWQCRLSGSSAAEQGD